MKLSRAELRILIESEIERSQEAIAHAKSMRTDGLSFEAFTGLIVDQLDLYDEWIGDISVKDVVKKLKGDYTPEEEESWGEPQSDQKGLAGETYEKTSDDYNEHPEWFN